MNFDFKALNDDYGNSFRKLHTGGIIKNGQFGFIPSIIEIISRMPFTICLGNGQFMTLNKGRR